MARSRRCMPLAIRSSRRGGKSAGSVRATSSSARGMVCSRSAGSRPRQSGRHLPSPPSARSGEAESHRRRNGGFCRPPSQACTGCVEAGRRRPRAASTLCRRTARGGSARPAAGESKCNIRAISNKRLLKHDPFHKGPGHRPADALSRLSGRTTRQRVEASEAASSNPIEKARIVNWNDSK